jgi:peptide/nickel transport system ATP-binding protein
MDARRLPGAGGAEADAPIVALANVSKRFAAPLGIGARLARTLLPSARRAPVPAVHAVDRVSFAMRSGEVLGLVGESGCGKSTLGRIVAGIHAPSEGTASFRGEPIARIEGERLVKRTTRVQMIFQDPFASLNPRHRVARIVGEGAVAHGLVAAAEIDDYVSHLLGRVGLDPAYRRRYPHQFSGGQRQRIGVARALAMQPEFLVCDEAVSALDVSIQAQVLNLFMELRDELGLTYLFISHDLSVVRHLSERVAIMYLGRLVEVGGTESIFREPLHPYTQALLANRLSIRERRRTFVPIRGEIPSPLDPPPGCHFHPRCPLATDRCRVEVPALREVGGGRIVACHLVDG